MAFTTLRRATVLSMATLVCGLTGCAAGAAPDQRETNLGQAIQPIIHGTASGTEHDSVVVIATFKDGERVGLCTATLVAPNVVVTARHCVSDVDPAVGCSKEGTAITGAGVRANRPAASLAVFAGPSGVVPDTTVEANASARGAKLLVSASTTICNRDVALVVLDRKLAQPAAPLRLDPPGATEKLAAVGWGVDETGKLTKGRFARKDLALVGVGPAFYPDTEVWGYGSSEFMLGESICAGDSGGPAFMASGALVGIASRVGNGKPRDPDNFASTCIGDTAHAVYTHLSEHRPLIERAFQEAGEPLWLEGQPNPFAAVEPPPAPPVTEPPPPAAAPSETAGLEAMPAEPVTPPPPPANAGGCSLTSEPEKDAVANAIGILAGLVFVASLRRRFSRQRPRETPHRERMPSLS